MSRLSKIFSVVLIILILTAFTAPTASAAPEEPEPDLGAVQFLSIPVAFIIAGVSISVMGQSVVDIGGLLGVFWDGAMETWGKFVSDVSDAINNLYQSQKFVDIKSKESKAIIAAINAIYDASGGKPKKDDKVYVEAKKSGDGKSIEIRTKPMTEDEA